MSLIQYLKKKISVPNVPAALPIEMCLTEEQETSGTYTWEKWEKESKAKYPIRFFLSRTLPTFISRYFTGIYAPIPRLWYWIRCHTIARYHMLDLRQPNYKYGYIDPVNKIQYACFNILKDFVEKEKPYNLREDHSNEEIVSDIGMKRQQEVYDEVMALYKYWTVERAKLQEEIEDKYELISRTRKTNYKQYIKDLLAIRKEEVKFEELEDEMLIRMMKIRSGMWT